MSATAVVQDIIELFPNLLHRCSSLIALVKEST